MVVLLIFECFKVQGPAPDRWEAEVNNHHRRHRRDRHHHTNCHQEHHNAHFDWT